MLWVLDGHTPVPVTDEAQILREVRRDLMRQVRRTEWGTVYVSTVFLSIDHSMGHGPNLLFETMTGEVPGMEEYQQRYATWEQAMRGHAEAVALAEGILRIPKTADLHADHLHLAAAPSAPPVVEPRTAWERLLRASEDDT